MDTKNNFEQPLSQEKALENFKQEIKDLRDKEIEEKDEKANFDLVNIQTEELTKEDMDIWKRYKELTVENISQKDINDFNKYRNSIDKKSSRSYFCMFLANELFSLWLMKDTKGNKEE